MLLLGLVDGAGAWLAAVWSLVRPVPAALLLPAAPWAVELPPTADCDVEEVSLLTGGLVEGAVAAMVLSDGLLWSLVLPAMEPGALTLPAVEP
jgi:hypothetical protein